MMDVRNTESLTADYLMAFLAIREMRGTRYEGSNSWRDAQHRYRDSRDTIAARGESLPAPQHSEMLQDVMDADLRKPLGTYRSEVCRAVARDHVRRARQASAPAHDAGSCAQCAADMPSNVPSGPQAGAFLGTFG